ncbi:MAG TPA: PD-(D/E)XK nuclease family protein [Bacillus sp. (in: firmicutes)]|nr:PD-(D/E)XK nuclease family protein [Bacillus sp. (in: firmicutes)]
MFEIRDFPEFSWSYSRHKTWTDCARKYGYEYYFAHNGWLYDAPASAQYTYRLKKLVSLPILFGQAVHNVIENTIKQYAQKGCIPHLKELEQRVRIELRTAFLDSRDRGDQWFQKPNRYTMLFDMYYYGHLPEKRVQEIHKHLNICLQNFLHSKSFRELTSSEKIKVIEPEKFRSIEMNGVKVYAVMDVIYHDSENDKWVIVDWKTGKHSSDDIGQLAVYALYLMTKWDIPLEKIVVRNEYLLTGSCHTYHLTSHDIDAMMEQMNESVQAMATYQHDGETNEPVPLEQFEPTSHTFRCQRCNYKEICLDSAVSQPPPYEYA